jgi:hypothetical protein
VSCGFGRRTNPSRSAISPGRGKYVCARAFDGSPGVDGIRGRRSTGDSYRRLMQKTHIALALGLAACQRGFSVTFVTAATSPRCSTGSPSTSISGDEQMNRCLSPATLQGPATTAHPGYRRRRRSRYRQNPRHLIPADPLIPVKPPIWRGARGLSPYPSAAAVSGRPYSATVTGFASAVDTYTRFEELHG